MNEIYKQLEELEREQKELLNKIVELRGSIKSVLPQRTGDLLECYQDIITKHKEYDLFEYYNLNYDIIKGYTCKNYVQNIFGEWTLYTSNADYLFNIAIVGEFMTLIIDHSEKTIYVVEIYEL